MYTLKHLNNEYVLLSDEEIKHETGNVWDLKETKFHPFLKQLGNTDIVYEKIANGDFKKVLASTTPREGIYLLDEGNIEKCKEEWSQQFIILRMAIPSMYDWTAEIEMEEREEYEPNELKLRKCLKVPKVTNGYINILKLS
jgi:hypothetical protein